MASIQNTEVIEDGVINLKLNRIAEKIPMETSDKIILNYPLKVPRKIKILNSTATRTTSANGISLGTLSTTKRTFIVGCQLFNQSSAAADNTRIAIYTTDLNGAVTRLADFTKITLTATTQNTYNFFGEEGIECLRGGTISFDNVFTVGASTSSMLVFGYEID